MRPSDAARPPRAPARRRAGGRSRPGRVTVFLIIATAVVAVVACLRVAALTGAFSNRAAAPRPVVPSPAPSAATASAGASPSTLAMRPDQKRTSASLAPATRGATSRPPRVPATLTSPESAAAPTAAASGQLPVAVSYQVDKQAGDLFQAEVKVTNDGPAAVSGWWVVLVLPGDQVTAVANASESSSGSYLLLQPPSPGSSAIAPGETFRVYVDAQGTQTVPEVCEFETVNCG